MSAPDDAWQRPQPDGRVYDYPACAEEFPTSPLRAPVYAPVWLVMTLLHEGAL